MRQAVAHRVIPAEGVQGVLEAALEGPPQLGKRVGPEHCHHPTEWQRGCAGSPRVCRSGPITQVPGLFQGLAGEGVGRGDAQDARWQATQ